MGKSCETEMEDEENGIEFILADIGGTFGKFQVCLIPECERLEEVVFKPNWLTYSTPFKNDRPDSCYRYENKNSNQWDNTLCDINTFNRSMISYCGDGVTVYKTDEVSIINEFDLTCDGNRWKLAMVGTLSNIGRLIFLPIVGYVSDRFGRKTVLVYSTLFASILKICKSFATDYNMFVMWEMVDSGFSSAIYPAALILAMELSTSNHNILISCLVLVPYPLGQVVTAFVASYLHNYKWLLRVLSLFGLMTFPFIWTLSESLRWLLVNRKYDKAIKLVEKATRINGLSVSTKSYAIIQRECNSVHTTAEVNNHGSFKDILLSCTLLTRFMICAFCWVASAFVTYGVSILSVSLQGDKYVNFMVVSFSGTPGMLLTYVMLMYVSRRWSMCISFIVTGLSILASKYFSWHATISLIFFFLGKLFINHAFSALYIYTNEMWPTSFRHSVMGTCSMIARFGSIAAPMAPLLMSVMELLPFYLFSGFAFLSAVMILFLPETFRQKKLPDSINDVKKLTTSN